MLHASTTMHEVQQHNPGYSSFGTTPGRFLRLVISQLGACLFFPLPPRGRYYFLAERSLLFRIFPPQNTVYQERTLQREELICLL